MDRRAFLGAGAVAVVGALTGCLGRTPFADGPRTELVEESFDPPTVDAVRVASDVGDVLVAGGDTDRIDVRVEKRSVDGQRGLDDVLVTVVVDRGVLFVESVLAEGRRLRTGSVPSTDISITVPMGSAGPAVDAVRSDLGTVTLRDVRGDARIETDLGDIVATGVDGYLSLHSDLGSITATDVRGLDGVSTDLGKVDVALLALRGDVAIGTDAGDVMVHVADDLDLDVVAESNGRVSSDLPLTAATTSRGRQTGRLNRGGPRLHAFSDLGTVSLRRAKRSA